MAVRFHPLLFVILIFPSLNVARRGLDVYVKFVFVRLALQFYAAHV